MANINVRVGQKQGIKVIASNRSSTSSISDLTDVDITAKANYSILMYDSTTNKYIHVTPAYIMDLADAVPNDVIDYGNF